MRLTCLRKRACRDFLGAGFNISLLQRTTAILPERVKVEAVNW